MDPSSSSDTSSDPKSRELARFSVANVISEEEEEEDQDEERAPLTPSADGGNSNSNSRRQHAPPIGIISRPGSSSATGVSSSGRRVTMVPSTSTSSRRRSSSDEDVAHPGHHPSLSSTSHGTLYLKSLRHYLTREALPSESHYRNILSFSGDGDGGMGKKFARPTLEELHHGRAKTAEAEAAAAEAAGMGMEDAEKSEARAAAANGKVVKFGWITGVFMRCLLNIWGVMLFLRLSWVVGQCGILQGILVITLCNVVTIITAISMSAVSTNGLIKAGGIYYMISRSLGPEFGGAIGIMFTIANSIAVATYLIGFCDSLVDMLSEYSSDFEGIVGTLDDRANDIRIIGLVTLILILALAIVGMEWVTRVQMILLLLLIGSQLDFIVGSFLPAESEKKFGFVGYSSEVFLKNLLTTNYHASVEGEKRQPPPGFFDVFGVFFPAVTGIVAGANLSGDLKDPVTAIPKGTLSAILVTFLSYITYGTMIGSCYLSEASGVEEEYWAHVSGNASIVHFDNCTDRICKFGSSNDQQTLSKISFTGFLVYAGCFAATLSSAIASLVGAPRVLQALAKDNLYPFIGCFAKGQGANNDPVRGYILVFFIALGCTMLGNLDVVSTLLSNFFVAAYALINFSVFHSSISKSPGWRPSFKYYNEWISLLGTVLCVAVMLLMGWVTAIITLVSVGVLYFYITYRKPEANWGSSTEAQQFLTALKNLHTLNETSEHVKNFRPKILVFTGTPSSRIPLLDFANLITKKLSLLVCAGIEDAPASRLADQRRSVEAWMRSNGVKGFFAAVPNKSFSEGATAIMNLGGLGKMTPNMILLGYKRNWHESLKSTEEYINVVHHGFDLNLAVGILRLKNGCDFSDVIADDDEEQQEVTSAAVAAAAAEPSLGSTTSSKEENREDQDGHGDACVQMAIPDESNVIVLKDDDKENDDEKKLAAVSPTKVTRWPSRKEGRGSIYHGKNGLPLPKEVADSIAQFKQGPRKGFIDVWWLYDDGGLTLLLPYILTTRSHFAACKLRVFALANRKDELDRETRNMAALLSKFRIDYSDVTVLPDVTKKALEETEQEFSEILARVDVSIPPLELIAHKAKTNRHLRIAELLREHSQDSEMVIMTLPMIRKGATSASLYMSWLEVMTARMPPFLLVRGNQTSVLTFYS